MYKQSVSPYKIQPYSYMKAEQLGVFIIPSKNPKYKIEVLDRQGKHLFHIGDAKYGDYPTFLAEGKYGPIYAERRRELYHLRHWKDANVPNSRGFFASQILW